MDALGGEGDVVQRVGAALIAKNKAVWRLLADSPHADELYGEHERGGAAYFAALESELGAVIERELAAAGAARPRLLTQLLLAASFRDRPQGAIGRRTGAGAAAVGRSPGAARIVVSG